MRKWMAMTLLLLTGCDTKLVTGYQPRRLGDSPATRRAYYAGKYTPEAHAAEQERVEDLRSRRPGAPDQPPGLSDVHPRPTRLQTSPQLASGSAGEEAAVRPAHPPTGHRAQLIGLWCRPRWPSLL